MTTQSRQDAEMKIILHQDKLALLPALSKVNHKSTCHLVKLCESQVFVGGWKTKRCCVILCIQSIPLIRWKEEARTVKTYNGTMQFSVSLWRIGRPTSSPVLSIQAKKWYCCIESLTTLLSKLPCPMTLFQFNETT